MKKLLLVALLAAAVVLAGCLEELENLVPPAVEPTPPGAECTEQWDCTSWSTCFGGWQERSCTDLRQCGTTDLKPLEKKACTEEGGEAVRTTVIGETVRAGPLDITVYEPQFMESYLIGSGVNARLESVPQFSRFLVVMVRVKNNSDKRAQINLSDMYAVEDTSGREFRQKRQLREDSLISTTLFGRQQVSGAVIFEVARGAESFTFNYDLENQNIGVKEVAWKISLEKIVERKCTGLGTLSYAAHKYNVMTSVFTIMLKNTTTKNFREVWAAFDNNASIVSYDFTGMLADNVYRTISAKLSQPPAAASVDFALKITPEGGQETVEQISCAPAN